jgi:hypothetical protein
MREEDWNADTEERSSGEEHGRQRQQVCRRLLRTNCVALPPGGSSGLPQQHQRADWEVVQRMRMLEKLVRYLSASPFFPANTDFRSYTSLLRHLHGFC